MGGAVAVEGPPGLAPPRPPAVTRSPTEAVQFSAQVTGLWPESSLPSTLGHSGWGPGQGDLSERGTICPEFPGFPNYLLTPLPLSPLPKGLTILWPLLLSCGGLCVCERVSSESCGHSPSLCLAVCLCISGCLLKAGVPQQIRVYK